jgi:hypothetical protein
VWPVANQTFTPLGTGMIAAPAHNRESAQALPCRCRYPRGRVGPTKLDCYITALPTRMGRGGRFRLSGGDCRSGLGHDHRHQSRRVRPWLLDPAKLYPPTEQPTDMDAGRAGNLGDDRVWLKAGSDEALFVFA